MKTLKMKLRNRKTGEIKSIEEIIRDAFLSNELDLLKNIDANWEEIEPKEPLIKDEKIRKAVRAWADVNGCDKLWVKLWEYCGHGAISFYDKNAGDNEITFNTVEKFGLEHLKYYTITELCGEEEE